MENQYVLCRRAEGCLTDVCKTVQNIQMQYELLWQPRLLNPQFYILQYQNGGKSVLHKTSTLYIYRNNLIKYEELEMDVNLF
jgi:hypothetical protein